MRRQDHYEVLDGLRGCAAISVVLYHLGHWLNIPHLADNSGLAVDFFFCLSGLVLPRAYGARRRPDLNFWTFGTIRIVRLMPLIVLATIISMTYVALRLLITHNHGDFDHLLVAGVLGAFAVPYLHAPASIGGPQVFPLNGPEYTLFLELAVNALWFPLRSFAPLATSVVLASLGVLGLALFGSGGDETATFWQGFPRVAASFFIGVAIFESLSRWALPQVIGWLFWPLCGVSLVLFFFPISLGSGAAFVWILAIAPLLVLSGSMIRPTGIVRKLCLWGGAVSYPIYVLQYPIFCWLNGLLQIALHARIARLEVPLIFVAIIGLSTLALAVFDVPVRRALQNRSFNAT